MLCANLMGIRQDWAVTLGSMLPPFLCTSSSGSDWRQQHQKRKLEMLQFWRDGLERQLAAINASITTLEGQISRDSTQSN